jgi:hypothetical protein
MGLLWLKRKGIRLKPGFGLLEPGLFWNCAFFIFIFLIYFSPFLTGVGVGTCFPTPPTAGLLVGCQWVIEPILSPLLNKLKHTGWF